MKTTTTPSNQQSSLLNNNKLKDIIPNYTNIIDDDNKNNNHVNENDNRGIHHEEGETAVWKHHERNKRYWLPFSFLILLLSIYFSIQKIKNEKAQNPPLLSSSSSSNPTQAQKAEKSPPPSPFPPNFIWGTGTSAYQIEGATHQDGRTPTIWDTYCTIPNKILDGSNGDVACDHYHRVQQDVLLMKEELGLKHYRFSIAWTRIVPDGKAGSPINPAGIDFYNHLIDTLLKHDIQPWVTLHHWDVPQSLFDSYGGWINTKIIDDFTYYATICFQAFGDRVKHWVTINEPWTIAVNGYASGIHAPGRYQRSDVEPYLVGHVLLLAHARVARLYRAEYATTTQEGIIGISNSGDYRYAKDERKEQDCRAAERSMEFQLGWFSDPILKGDYPASMRERLGDRLPHFTREEKKDLLGSADFLGLNHYSSLLVSEPLEPKSFGGYWGNDVFINVHENPQWEQNCMGWNIVPSGIKDILLWIHQRYHPSNVTIYITENGSCEYEPNVETARYDIRRKQYLQSYIQAVGHAIAEGGVNVGGYFAWSLMDNFEWQFGYQRRFGLYYVDFDTLERMPKLSALWYRDTMKLNGANIGL